MRTPFLLLAALALLASPAAAQPEGVAPGEKYVGGEAYDAGPGRLGRAAFGVVLQRYAIGAGATIRETSFPLHVFVPVGSSAGVSLRTGYASAGGEGVAGLGGLADALLGASYRHDLGAASVVVSLGLSLPAGRASFTPEEFGTAVLLAQHEFGFEVPAFGQGFRASPGVMLAVPTGEGVVLGLGASYQLRSGFRPFEDDEGVYSPANETLLTLGADFSLGAASALSLDATYALYGSDSFAGRDFEPGSKFGFTARLLTAIGPHALHVLARYRTVGEGTTFAGDPLAPIRPTQAQLGLAADLALPERVGLGLLVGARYFGDFAEIGSVASEPTLEGVLALTDHQLVFDLGASPSVAVAERVRLNAGFTYSVGLGEFIDVAELPPLSGFRLGFGLEVAF